MSNKELKQINEAYNHVKEIALIFKERGNEEVYDDYICEMIGIDRVMKVIGYEYKYSLKEFVKVEND